MSGETQGVCGNPVDGLPVLSLSSYFLLTTCGPGVRGIAMQIKA